MPVSEMPGSAAVGIETVEWFADTGGSLTLQITGRWRRRRPVGAGQPTLVVEADGRRQRFPAMPEPPSLAGTGPGVWRLSFTVPRGLAPDLGRSWLQFGSVMAPLPMARPAEGPAPPGEMPSVQLRADALPLPAPASANGSPAGAPASNGAAGTPPAPPGPPTLAPGAPPAPPGPPTLAPGAPGPDLADLADRITALERDLQVARAERDELVDALSESDRTRRRAEQRAHAEQALRQDLARQVSSNVQEAERARQVLGEVAAAEDRIRVLEEELAVARRRSDEADQVAAAATAARERAERRLARGTVSPGADGAEAARVGFEARLRELRAAAVARVPAEPAAADLPPPSEAPSRPATPPRPDPGFGPGYIGLLRQEIDARAHAEAGLRARLVDAEARLAARVLLDRRTAAAIGQLRTELATLREAVGRERVRRDGAERRVAELEHALDRQRAVSRHACMAIAELRRSLRELTAPAAPAPAPGPGAPAAPAAPDLDPSGASDSSGVEAARLRDALSRLRQSIPPQEPGPEPEPGAGSAEPADPTPPELAAPSAAGGTPSLADQPALHQVLGRRSLEVAFRRLVRSDADAAGRLLLALLPLQSIAHPAPVTYDLVLGRGRSCVCVTAAGGSPLIAVQSVPRPRDAVDFQVRGEPARIARLLTAGWFRRRFGRNVARVRGDRAALSALSALLSTPLDLRAIHGHGVRLDAATALSLVASMIDPAWTAGERFTLAHEEGGRATAFLLIAGRRPPQVIRAAPPAAVATTLACPGDQLLAALAGLDVEGLVVRGDAAPLSALRQWIKRAECE